MRLPGIENAVVDPKKIRDYLLSTTHPLGRFKATFFLDLGYTVSTWGLLATELRELANQHEAEPVSSTSYGQKYLVRGMLVGPSGQSAPIVTVWIVLAGQAVPRFVTAFPGGEE